MNWISVFKSLPDQCMPVKVKTKDLKEYKAMFFPQREDSPKGFLKSEFRFLDDGYKIDNVTHWRAMRN